MSSKWIKQLGTQSVHKWTNATAAAVATKEKNHNNVRMRQFVGFLCERMFILQRKHCVLVTVAIISTADRIEIIT